MLSKREQLSAIKDLPLEEQTDYQPFFLGNDISLKNNDLMSHQMTEYFALIGTALFRSIDIACALTATNRNVVPTIVIVDNSCNIRKAWECIKKCFADAPENPDINEFLYAPDTGLTEVLLNLMDEEKIRIDGDLPNFFRIFFKNHPFEHVRKLVANVHVIVQSWADSTVFKELKSIFSDQPIVAYSSNIIDFVGPEIQIPILHNLEHLNPCLSLCTNFDKIKRIPTERFVFRDNNPLIMCEALKLSEEVRKHFLNEDHTQEMQTDVLDTQTADPDVESDNQMQP